MDKPTDATAAEFKHRAASAAEVFHQYGDFIRNSIRTHVQDEHQVEDLVQTFFISLVRKPVPEDIENIEGYLHKAIVNDILDVSRRDKRCHYSIRIYAELSKHPAEQTTPLDIMIQLEQIGKALELLKHQLPPREAVAVDLRYRKQRSVTEAAEEMGVDCMTLRGYVCQGLCRIRRLLRNFGVDMEE